MVTRAALLVLLVGCAESHADGDASTGDAGLECDGIHVRMVVEGAAGERWDTGCLPSAGHLLMWFGESSGCEVVSASASAEGAGFHINVGGDRDWFRMAGAHDSWITVFAIPDGPVGTFAPYGVDECAVEVRTPGQWVGDVVEARLLRPCTLVASEMPSSSITITEMSMRAELAINGAYPPSRPEFCPMP